MPLNARTGQEDLRCLRAGALPRGLLRAGVRPDDVDEAVRERVGRD